MSQSFNISSDEAFSKEVDANPTLLSSLREELKRKVAKEPITMTVPGREKVSIKFDTNIEANMMQQWRKRSLNKLIPDGFDAVKFASIVIANQSSAIYFDREEAIGSDSEPLTFKHQELLDMLGVSSAVEAVKAMYGVDGHILQTADKIVTAAGYGEDLEEGGDPF